jgi:hypothetical protein
VFDVIPSQSVQALLVNGQTAYVAAEKQLVKYDLKSETKQYPAYTMEQLRIL